MTVGSSCRLPEPTSRGKDITKSWLDDTDRPERRSERRNGVVGVVVVVRVAVWGLSQPKERRNDWENCTLQKKLLSSALKGCRFYTWIVVLQSSRIEMEDLLEHGKSKEWGNYPSIGQTHFPPPSLWEEEQPEEYPIKSKTAKRIGPLNCWL